VLGSLIPVLMFFQDKLSVAFRKTREQMDRLGRASSEPTDKLKKAQFNGLQVIRAFKKESESITEFKAVMLEEYQFDRLRTCVYKFFGIVDSWKYTALEALALLCTMAHRGPAQAVPLIIAIDQLKSFQHLTHAMKETWDNQK